MDKIARKLANKVIQFPEKRVGGGKKMYLTIKKKQSTLANFLEPLVSSLKQVTERKQINWVDELPYNNDITEDELTAHFEGKDN